MLDEGRLNWVDAFACVKYADLAIVLSPSEQIGILQVVAHTHERAARFQLIDWLIWVAHVPHPA